MIYEASPIAVTLFVFFVLMVLGLSFFFARKAKSSAGYYAAGGNIHWGVNGIAFAGDYLSAASFLGICGMIATTGYDGFLYSIGFLAGWVVALFVVAEPLKRLGKYTFTDALDAKFNSPGIQLMSSISTLVVSVCYLIPQMVGAGDLVTPLLGLPQYMGVIMVGAIVTFIVATAGMTSTTYVQFLKGGMLIVCSVVLVGMLCYRGLSVTPQQNFHTLQTLPAQVAEGAVTPAAGSGYESLAVHKADKAGTFVKLSRENVATWWHLDESGPEPVLRETLSITRAAGKPTLYNGAPKEDRRFFQVGHMSKIMHKGQAVESTGPIGPLEMLRTIEHSTVVLYPETIILEDGGKTRVSVFYAKPTSGEALMRPGQKFKVGAAATLYSKLDFVSLMLALFFGTAALPHILIRYYTVPSPKDARKSTIVAIGAIGFFYILTMFMGLGAMVSGVIDVESSNMAAPLLAKSFGVTLFAVISALAFATVLGTVAGLIVAASGAVAHDFMDRFLGMKMADGAKVMAGKVVAIVVGAIAIVLGIAFKGVNVSFLVGLAFAVAASANLPAILMLIFWKGTTAKGIAASIFVGVVSSVAWIALSSELYKVYGLDPKTAIVPFTQPGIVSIPLSFVTLVIVSLLTQPRSDAPRSAGGEAVHAGGARGG